MSTSLAYHTQCIHGFQHKSYQFIEGKVIERLERNEFRCPGCYNSDVNTYPIRTRRIQALPYGSSELYFEVDIHRIYCPKCRQTSVETLPFLSHPKARITTALERTLIELRPDMTISALSNYFQVDWRIIKGCEKRHLERKYKHIKLKNVKIMGIDEIAIGKDEEGKTAYWTVVRDLESGAVLHVDRGKDGEALSGFLLRLRRARAKIEIVAMDMGKAFIAWVEKHFPEANIVFDHFHVIKLMNEKIEKVRRKIAAEMDENERKILKNQRFVLLRNEADLKPEAAEYLALIKDTFQELGEVHMMKESLRSIYNVVTNPIDAEAALRQWCETAKLIDSPDLHKMVNTLENHWEGVLGYWYFGGLSNAAMEGFNNKIRVLIRQAYGFHDHEYMRLKIFDLPNVSLKVTI